MQCKKETVIRSAVLLVSLINQGLVLFERNPLPFSDSVVYEGVSLLCTAVASIWAWWKNNSFTAAAVEADRYLKHLKSGEAAE
ncbi:MAG: phage holin [Clostridia bacterium]|nr:phage holin [Clostridia bacterium]